MYRSDFTLNPKASISLSSLLNRKAQSATSVLSRPSVAAGAAGFAPATPHVIHESDLAPVIVEATDPAAVTKAVGGGRVEPLAGRFVSAHVGADDLRALMDSPAVRRLQSKKRSYPTLSAALPDVRVLKSAQGPRIVAEDGQGVLIGVVDSGFDLSHPMFRDAAGKLRVDALLDQTGNNQEFDTQTLETGWGGGTGPGADANGHGTHVASTTGGTRFQNLEGVAPGARFLLVKTDFQNTDEAVAWIFRKAGSTPCVVNMSLGRHFGSHDGTDAEERLHQSLTGPGKIIVVAAGNERNDPIHMGGRFRVAQTEEVTFDLVRQRPGEDTFAVLTVWYSQDDRFDLTLITPSGQAIAQPKIGNATHQASSTLDLEFAVKRYAPSRLIQNQISISFTGANLQPQDLRSWKLRMTCSKATVGRLDAWFHNSGFANFRSHPLVETARTIGIPATGDGCLAIASHVTRTQFDTDAGTMEDTQAVLGASSLFSSLGPTRDGRSKPDFSAPGQWVTAALAGGSEEAAREDRSLTAERLLTISGTSMATPVMTGIVALMLQKKPGLDLARVRQILQQTARHDAHNGPAQWDPAFGFGKIDVAAALDKT
jgi:subtilisin family serine protease